MPTAYVGNRATGGTSFAVLANQMYVRPISLREDATIEALGFAPAATSGTVTVKGVLYARNAATGRPGALIAATPSHVGVTAGTLTDIAFTAGVPLAAGDYYAGLHIGSVAPTLYRDARMNINWFDSSAPYASGPPNPYNPSAVESSSDYRFWLRYTNDGTLDALTFGKTTVGTTFSGGWPTAGAKRVVRFTLPVGATVARITTQLNERHLTAKVKAVIYAAGVSTPGALLAASVEKVGIPGYERTDFWLPSPVALPAGDYYLGLIVDLALVMRSDDGFDSPFNSDAYADGPSDPFGTPTAGSSAPMIYAPYTPDITPPPATPRVIQPVWSGL